MDWGGAALAASGIPNFKWAHPLEAILTRKGAEDCARFRLIRSMLRWAILEMAVAFIKWSYYYAHIDRGGPMQKIPAAQFKSRCLAVMDQVAESGQPVVVTKHGKPVVQIIRVKSNQDDIFGFLAGKGRIVGDIENTIPVSDWNLPE